MRSLALPQPFWPAPAPDWLRQRHRTTAAGPGQSVPSPSTTTRAPRRPRRNCEPTATTVPADHRDYSTAAGQVIVDPGNYGSNPAVQGLVKTYPLYFQALVARDDTIVRKSFPAFFYADISESILEAKRNGWLMRPPGSVVVVGVQSQPQGVVR